ncbi:MAG: SpoIIIAH-like family protein [Clostridia bacterium]|nr:SpoIIIAH-like family protein [Clostridia bacterium]
MKFEKQTEAVKNFFAKLGKRNLIVICAVLLVGAAVAVNWAVFAGRDVSPAGNTPTNQGEETGASANNGNDSYFSATQVSRQRARDEALEVLQGVIDDSAADAEAKATALADLTQMAKDMEAESNIETLVMSKGFAQCVAVVGGGNVSVVVDVDSKPLNASQIAQINTVVFEQTGIKPANVVIIEK